MNRLSKVDLRSLAGGNSRLVTDPHAAHIQAESAHILEACTFCGKCFEVCPMVPYTEVKGANPERVVRGVIDILRDVPEPGREGVVWTQACQKSGLCVDACPEDVNPRKMLEYARIKLLHRAVPQEGRRRASRDYFKRLSRTLKLVAGIQMDPFRFRQLTSVRGERKERAPTVFYFGCNLLRTPHIIFTAMDVLDRLGVDYVVQGGVANCCGINHQRRGDVEWAGKVSAGSLANFAAFHPEQVLTFCPTCQIQYTEFVPLGQKPDFPFIHITQFLAENADGLRSLYVQPVPRRVALHEHEGVPGVRKNIRAILRSIPGLELVEIDQHYDHGYQCPTLALAPAKEAMLEKLFTSARAAGIDVLATVYHSCYRDLCGEEANQPFEVKNFISLVGEAMGIDHEERFKKYRLYRDVERVVEESEEFIRANGMDARQIRDAIGQELYGPPLPPSPVLPPPPSPQ
ncbi:MAG: (Fe-S)-binding protein [Nitrospinota bacterium]